MPSVLHVITGLEDGGAEGVLFRLCVADTHAQHVVVSLMGLGKYGPMLSAAGVTVHVLNMPKGRVSLAGLWKLWALLRQQRYDAVQTWMYHADVIGGVLARLAGQKRIVWNVRNSTLEAGASSRKTMWLLKLAARLSRWVPSTIVSCAQQATMVHVAQGYRASKFVHIPNGFDLARFAPDGPARQALRNEWRALGHTVVMGMVGRFDPQKDHHLLLRSFAKLHAQHTNTQLVLVGRGLDAHNTVLVQWIDDLGLNLCVTLLGQRQDVPKVMGALDVHVLSSRYGEAFPNVLAEAMACGTPCLTTDVGDAASVVGATGWVVPPNDETALGQGMLEALHEHQQHSADWQRRQVACRQRVTTEFDLNTMIDRYQQVWFDKSLGLNS